MSFNIRYGTAPDGDNRWELRRELVLRLIRDFNPDLLGMQEVLEFQANYLRENLPAYDFHGVGRDDGKQKGEFSPILFRRTRFAVLDAGNLWLSDTPDVPGSRGWDALLPRMLSWARLRDDSANGRELTIANTHFDHRGSQARLESARLIRRIGEANLHGQPAILTGDFNCTEDDPPYHALLAPNADGTAPLVDSYRAAHPERQPDEASANGWRPVTKGRRIDWILHSPNLQTVSARINRSQPNGHLPSDHYPVQAVLRYK